MWKNDVLSYEDLPGHVKQTLYEASGMEFFTFPTLAANKDLYATMYTGFSNGFTYFQRSEIDEDFLWNGADQYTTLKCDVEDHIDGYDPRCRNWY